VKAVTWSADCRIVALSRYDGKIVLLNTITFAPLAMIEHNTTVDQSSMPAHEQALIWREAVSASNERSYTLAAQPVPPPLSRPKPSTEPTELGVAEVSFSANGGYLATRDERMLSTAWIWNTATLAAHAVVMQHNNIRKVHWHPTRAALAMLDCGEGIGYLYDVSSSSPPIPMSAPMPAAAVLSWCNTDTEAEPAVLVAAKSSFRILYPDFRGTRPDDAAGKTDTGAEMFEEGESDDSILDVLTGQQPDESTPLDDTFRRKRVSTTDEADPLDDSQIF